MKPINPDDNPRNFERKLLIEGVKFCPECLIPMVIIEQTLRTPGASRRFIVGCVECQSENGGGFQIISRVIRENQSVSIPREAMTSHIDIGMCSSGDDADVLPEPEVENVVGIPQAYIPRPVLRKIKEAMERKSRRDRKKTKGKKKPRARGKR